MKVPNDLEVSQTYPMGDMSCDQPVKLEVGCSSWNFADIAYDDGDLHVKLSSTLDGSTLVVVNSASTELGSAIFELLTLQLVDPSALELAVGVRRITETLSGHDIEVVDIYVLTSFLDIWGYILFTDGDALSALGARPADAGESAQIAYP